MNILFLSINFFLLLTPFFVLSLFVDVCKNKSIKEKHKIAIKTSIYIFSICILLLFFGNSIFQCLGITLLAFQIGSGIILLLSGIEMVKGDIKTRNTDISEDPSLIPLTLPITVGPGTVGTIFVLSSKSSFYQNCLNSISLFIATFIIFLLLYYSETITKFLDKSKLQVITKLTGLFLAILGTKSILDGLSLFLNK